MKVSLLFDEISQKQFVLDCARRVYQSTTRAIEYRLSYHVLHVHPITRWFSVQLGKIALKLF